ncbi:hypothetical protein PF003_g6089 [Phytophthora fragariae]|nr:hypothetical protein PF003_g6089 [Phytophthora fragariae]
MTRTARATPTKFFTSFKLRTRSRSLETDYRQRESLLFHFEIPRTTSSAPAREEKKKSMADAPLDHEMTDASPQRTTPSPVLVCVSSADLTEFRG